MAVLIDTFSSYGSYIDAFPEFNLSMEHGIDLFLYNNSSNWEKYIKEEI